MDNKNDNYIACCKECDDNFPNEPSKSTCIKGCAQINGRPNGDTSVGHGVVAETIQGEIEKLGRKEVLKKIRSAAKNAFSKLPDDSETEKLDAISKQFVERIGAVIGSGLKATDWSDAGIAKYAQEVAWAKFSCNIAASFMARDNSGGGSGPTCVTRCANEYNQCISENSCDTSGWVCLCCVPCSLQYMGCVAGCATFSGGFGRLFIA